MIDVTVILCTYNRCQSLERALESVAAQILPESVAWEVLVVDNNSSDQTREVVQDFSHRYPGRFRYLFESKQGLSHARNAGIRAARGEIVAFVDDDVTVEQTWLQNLTTALHYDEWAGAGGRILPQWPCAPPSWLPEKEWYGMAPLVMFDLGLEGSRLTDAPFGANMAFKRRMFEKHGMFRTDLGPGSNKKLHTNDDTEFGRRLLEAGEQLRYEPSAVVYHEVPQKRLQRGHFLTWWFDKGRADIQETSGVTDSKWIVAGIPLFLLRKLAVGTLRWMVTVDPARRFSRKLAVWLIGGMMVQSYRQSREVGPKPEKLGCV
jgi:glycosyltransferase involved in cell wall biosynthesis